jgi:hypothetical protein
MSSVVTAIRSLQTTDSGLFNFFRIEIIQKTASSTAKELVDSFHTVSYV